MAYVTRRQLRRVRREARREGYADGYGTGFNAGYDSGHYQGCIEAHNGALSVVKNALAGGQAPARRMRARLHNTTVDLVANIVQGREQAAVQRAVNIIANRLARNRSIRVRMNGVVIRPTNGKPIP